MGDQLAKGWADSQAKPQEQSAETYAEYCAGMRNFFNAQAQREQREREAEIQAEEAFLP